MKSGILIWSLRLATAIILLQTLYFKFSGAEESVYIFSTLGIEPYGRIGLGILELIIAILILIPSISWLGALLASGIMIGALLSHVFVLGIVVQQDNGVLFSLALIAFFCSSALIFISRDKYFDLIKNKVVG